MSFKSNLAGVTTLLFLATLVRAQERCRTTSDCAAGSECHISYSAAHVAEGGVCFAPQRGGGGGGVATAPAMVLLEEADPGRLLYPAPLDEDEADPGRFFLPLPLPWLLVTLFMRGLLGVLRIADPGRLLLLLEVDRPLPFVSAMWSSATGIGGTSSP